MTALIFDLSLKKALAVGCPRGHSAAARSVDFEPELDMVSETRPLKVRLRDGTIKDCAVALSGGPPWKLLLSGIELGVPEFIRDDLFESLCAVREELEKIGAQALCAGARPEVFPSGMSRGMGGGRKAYVTRLGAPALRTDLVEIFDYAAPETVGTVAQQRAFREKWAESLRQ